MIRNDLKTGHWNNGTNQTVDKSELGIQMSAIQILLE